ncbi:MAG: hypothetical protein AAF985_01010, partial [Bacteroidota bacterium]
NVSPYQQLAIAAVNKNNLKLLKVLLNEQRINVNFTDLEDKTLLMRARAMEAQELMELLISHGAY